LFIDRVQRGQGRGFAAKTLAHPVVFGRRQVGEAAGDPADGLDELFEAAGASHRGRIRKWLCA
jgi:hypothetical protein